MNKPPHFPTALLAQFDAEEWNGLTSQERIGRCLLFADEALRCGAEAAPHAKDAYAELSLQWLALAEDIEKNSDSGLSPTPPRADGVRRD
jgi:hypothetical protein